MSVPTTLEKAVANVDVYITHINFYEAGADESSGSNILSGNLSDQRDIAIIVFLLDVYPGTPSSAEQHQITSELRQLL